MKWWAMVTATLAGAAFAAAGWLGTLPSSTQGAEILYVALGRRSTDWASIIGGVGFLLAVTAVALMLVLAVRAVGHHRGGRAEDRTTIVAALLWLPLASVFVPAGIGSLDNGLSSDGARYVTATAPDGFTVLLRQVDSANDIRYHSLFEKTGTYTWTEVTLQPDVDASSGSCTLSALKYGNRWLHCGDDVVALQIP